MQNADAQRELDFACPYCGRPTHTEKVNKRKTAPETNERHKRIITVLVGLKGDALASQTQIRNKTKLSSDEIYNDLQTLTRWKIIRKIGSEKGVLYCLNL
jgi:predicted HTH transcriptional regulator